MAARSGERGERALRAVGFPRPGPGLAAARGGPVRACPPLAPACAPLSPATAATTGICEHPGCVHSAHPRAHGKEPGAGLGRPAAPSPCPEPGTESPPASDTRPRAPGHRGPALSRTPCPAERGGRAPRVPPPRSLPSSPRGAGSVTKRREGTRSQVGGARYAPRVPAPALRSPPPRAPLGRLRQNKAPRRVSVGPRRRAPKAGHEGGLDAGGRGAPRTAPLGPRRRAPVDTVTSWWLSGSSRRLAPTSPFLAPFCPVSSVSPGLFLRLVPFTLSPCPSAFFPHLFPLFFPTERQCPVDLRRPPCVPGLGEGRGEMAPLRFSFQRL